MQFQRKQLRVKESVSRYDEIDEIVKLQREFHEQEENRSVPRQRRHVPKNEMSFLLRQRRGKRVEFEKHPSAPNPDYVPHKDPHFVATIRGFLQVNEDGSYRTTANPRWATTFSTFEEADAAAQKACKQLFDVRGQFYAVFVKP